MSNNSIKEAPAPVPGQSCLEYKNLIDLMKIKPSTLPNEYWWVYQRGRGNLEKDDPKNPAILD